MTKKLDFSTKNQPETGPWKNDPPPLLASLLLSVWCDDLKSPATFYVNFAKSRGARWQTFCKITVEIRLLFNQRISSRPMCPVSDMNFGNKNFSVPNLKKV